MGIQQLASNKITCKNFTTYSNNKIKMSEEAETVAAPATTTEETKAKPAPKSVKAATAKKPKSKPTHPTVAVMIEAAISNLKERTGSSLVAIKKYIATNYKVDVVKLNPHIKKSLINGVEKKTLIRVKKREQVDHLNWVNQTTNPKNQR